MRHENASRVRDARLTDVVLDGATLQDCDLRGADLSLQHPRSLLGTTRGTCFVRCDLRGANLSARRLENTTFIDCTFHGVVGRPELVGAIHVVHPDFSAAADGSYMLSMYGALGLVEPRIATLATGGSILPLLCGPPPTPLPPAPLCASRCRGPTSR